MDLMKTLTFAAVHFSVAFAVGYALTGSVVIGGTIALVEPLCNTVAFYLHEKAWKFASAKARESAGSDDIHVCWLKASCP